MKVASLLRIGREGRKNRRGSPRIRCRLHCTIRTRRKWIPARILDVSEGGLCLLSPIPLKQKQRIILRIDVPPSGSVEVEAIAWHVRRVKSGRAHRKAWSIGMMISKAGAGFQALLPGGAEDFDCGPSEELLSKLAQLAEEPAVPPSPEPDDPDPVLEESRAAAGLDDPHLDPLSPEEFDYLELDLLSAEELDDLDLDLLTPAELDAVSTQPKPSPDDSLQMFRVRVKAKTGPRTRTLTLGAISTAEAEKLARSGLDESWLILEVVAALPPLDG